MNERTVGRIKTFFLDLFSKLFSTEDFGYMIISKMFNEKLDSISINAKEGTKRIIGELNFEDNSLLLR